MDQNNPNDRGNQIRITGGRFAKPTLGNVKKNENNDENNNIQTEQNNSEDVQNDKKKQQRLSISTLMNENNITKNSQPPINPPPDLSSFNKGENRQQANGVQPISTLPLQTPLLSPTLSQNNQFQNTYQLNPIKSQPHLNDNNNNNNSEKFSTPPFPPATTPSSPIEINQCSRNSNNELVISPRVYFEVYTRVESLYLLKELTQKKYLAEHFFFNRQYYPDQGQNNSKTRRDPPHIDMVKLPPNINDRNVWERMLLISLVRPQSPEDLVAIFNFLHFGQNDENFIQFSQSVQEIASLCEVSYDPSSTEYRNNVLTLIDNNVEPYILTLTEKDKILTKNGHIFDSRIQTFSPYRIMFEYFFTFCSSSQRNSDLLFNVIWPTIQRCVIELPYNLALDCNWGGDPFEMPKLNSSIFRTMKQTNRISDAPDDIVGLKKRTLWLESDHACGELGVSFQDALQEVSMIICSENQNNEILAQNAQIREKQRNLDSFGPINIDYIANVSVHNMGNDGVHYLGQNDGNCGNIEKIEKSNIFPTPNPTPNPTPYSTTSTPTPTLANTTINPTPLDTQLPLISQPFFENLKKMDFSDPEILQKEFGIFLGPENNLSLLPQTDIDKRIDKHDDKHDETLQFTQLITDLIASPGNRTISSPPGLYFGPQQAKLVLSRRTVAGLLALRFFGNCWDSSGTGGQFGQLNDFGGIWTNLGTNQASAAKFESMLMYFAYFHPSEEYDTPFPGMDLDSIDNPDNLDNTHAQDGFLFPQLKNIQNYPIWPPYTSYNNIQGTIEYVLNGPMINLDYFIDMTLGRMRVRNDLFFSEFEISSQMQKILKKDAFSAISYAYKPKHLNLTDPNIDMIKKVKKAVRKKNYFDVMEKIKQNKAQNSEHSKNTPNTPNHPQTSSLPPYDFSEDSDIDPFDELHVQPLENELYQHNYKHSEGIQPGIDIESIIPGTIRHLYTPNPKLYSLAEYSVGVHTCDGRRYGPGLVGDSFNNRLKNRLNEVLEGASYRYREYEGFFSEGEQSEDDGVDGVDGGDEEKNGMESDEKIMTKKNKKNGTKMVQKAPYNIDPYDDTINIHSADPEPSSKSPYFRWLYGQDAIQAYCYLLFFSHRKIFATVCGGTGENLQNLTQNAPTTYTNTAALHIESLKNSFKEMSMLWGFDTGYINDLFDETFGIFSKSFSNQEQNFVQNDDESKKNDQRSAKISPQSPYSSRKPIKFLSFLPNITQYEYHLKQMAFLSSFLHQNNPNIQIENFDFSKFDLTYTGANDNGINAPKWRSKTYGSNGDRINPGNKGQNGQVRQNQQNNRPNTTRQNTQQPAPAPAPQTNSKQQNILQMFQRHSAPNNVQNSNQNSAPSNSHLFDDYDDKTDNTHYPPRRNQSSGYYLGDDGEVGREEVFSTPNSNQQNLQNFNQNSHQNYYSAQDYQGSNQMYDEDMFGAIDDDDEASLAAQIAEIDDMYQNNQQSNQNNQQQLPPRGGRFASHVNSRGGPNDQNNQQNNQNRYNNQQNNNNYLDNDPFAHNSPYGPPPTLPNAFNLHNEITNDDQNGVFQNCSSFNPQNARNAQDLNCANYFAKKGPKIDIFAPSIAVNETSFGDYSTLFKTTEIDTKTFPSNPYFNGLFPSKLQNVYKKQLNTKSYQHFEQKTNQNCFESQNQTLPEKIAAQISPTSLRFETMPMEFINSTAISDFANQQIGGGTFHQGAVQEEILFSNCFEATLSMTICSKLEETTAMRIIGVVKHAVCSGYAHSLKFSQNLTMFDNEFSQIQKNYQNNYQNDQNNYQNDQNYNEKSDKKNNFSVFDQIDNITEDILERYPISYEKLAYPLLLPPISPSLQKDDPIPVSVPFIQCEEEMDDEMDEKKQKKHYSMPILNYPTYTIAVIDAKQFNQTSVSEQYNRTAIKREFIKLISGLANLDSYTDSDNLFFRNFSLQKLYQISVTPKGQKNTIPYLYNQYKAQYPDLLNNSNVYISLVDDKYKSINYDPFLTHLNVSASQTISTHLLTKIALTERRRQHILTTLCGGNWGCGVFNGIHQLKLILQILATSVSDVYLRYYPVNDPKTDKFHQIISFFYEKNLTIHQLGYVLTKLSLSFKINNITGIQWVKEPDLGDNILNFLEPVHWKTSQQGVYQTSLQRLTTRYFDEIPEYDKDNNDNVLFDSVSEELVSLCCEERKQKVISRSIFSFFSLHSFFYSISLSVPNFSFLVKSLRNNWLKNAPNFPPQTIPLNSPTLTTITTTTTTTTTTTAISPPADTTTPLNKQPSLYNILINHGVSFHALLMEAIEEPEQNLINNTSNCAQNALKKSQDLTLYTKIQHNSQKNVLKLTPNDTVLEFIQNCTDISFKLDQFIVDYAEWCNVENKMTQTKLKLGTISSKIDEYEALKGSFDLQIAEVEDKYNDWKVRMGEIVSIGNVIKETGQSIGKNEQHGINGYNNGVKRKSMVMGDDDDDGDGDDGDGDDGDQYDQSSAIRTQPPSYQEQQQRQKYILLLQHLKDQQNKANDYVVKYLELDEKYKKSFLDENNNYDLIQTKLNNFLIQNKSELNNLILIFKNKNLIQNKKLLRSPIAIDDDDDDNDDNDGNEDQDDENNINDCFNNDNHPLYLLDEDYDQDDVNLDEIIIDQNQNFNQKNSTHNSDQNISDQYRIIQSLKAKIDIILDNDHQRQTNLGSLKKAAAKAKQNVNSVQKMIQKLQILGNQAKIALNKFERYVVVLQQMYEVWVKMVQIWIVQNDVNFEVEIDQNNNSKKFNFLNQFSPQKLFHPPYFPTTNTTIQLMTFPTFLSRFSIINTSITPIFSQTHLSQWINSTQIDLQKKALEDVSLFDFIIFFTKKIPNVFQNCFTQLPTVTLKYPTQPMLLSLSTLLFDTGFLAESNDFCDSLNRILNDRNIDQNDVDEDGETELSNSDHNLGGKTAQKKSKLKNPFNFDNLRALLPPITIDQNVRNNDTVGSVISLGNG